MKDINGQELSPPGIGGHQPWMLTCSDDTLIHMYDIEKCQLVRSFVGNQRFVTHVKFNNISNLVLSAGTDQTISLWDIRSNKLIFKILAHPEPITSIDISSDSSIISSSSYDCYVRLWDVVKGQCLKTMMSEEGSKDPLSFCRFTPKTAEYMLFGMMNSTIGLYNHKNELLKQYKGHLNESLQIDAKFVKNQKTGRDMIISGSEDGYLYGWDLNTQKLQIRLPVVQDQMENRVEDEDQDMLDQGQIQSSNNIIDERVKARM